MNGKSCGYFSFIRGLRQGDHLSPFLYIIASAIISRGLQKLHNDFISLRYSSVNDGHIISHLTYADDIIIICNGASLSLKKHMSSLEKVAMFTGLTSNKLKSCFATRKNHGPRESIIKSITGFQKKDLPMTNLGCPLY